MNLKYHISEPKIMCPYCDKACEDDEYFMYQNVGENVVFECEHCAKKFWVAAQIAYDSYSDCALNNKKHEFASDSEKFPHLFHCKNCSQYDVREHQPHPTPPAACIENG